MSSCSAHRSSYPGQTGRMQEPRLRQSPLKFSLSCASPQLERHVHVVKPQQQPRTILQVRDVVRTRPETEFYPGVASCKSPDAELRIAYTELAGYLQEVPGFSC